MSYGRPCKWFIALLAGCCLIVSCGGEEEDALPPIAEEKEVVAPTVAPTPTPAPDTDNTDLRTKPLVTIPDSEPPLTLEIEDLVIGEGAQVAAGDSLIMDYVGVSYSTGLQFDASWDRGQPFPFELGAGRVIKGWDEGIVGMAVGGRRILTIPPDMGYGDSGSGSGSIGPNETLVFIVDLRAAVPSDLEKPNVSIAGGATEELLLEDLIEGTGRTATPGDVLYIHYVGVSQSTGQQFDSSWDRGRSEFIGLIAGAGNVIKGLDEGLIGMKVGGRRNLVIPPSLAYGENGAGGGVIAPNETLVFTVDLLGAQPFG